MPAAETLAKVLLVYRIDMVEISYEPRVTGHEYRAASFEFLVPEPLLLEICVAPS
jgi:hypothetical protein